MLFAVYIIKRCCFCAIYSPLRRFVRFHMWDGPGSHNRYVIRQVAIGVWTPGGEAERRALTSPVQDYSVIDNAGPNYNLHASGAHFRPDDFFDVNDVTGQLILGSMLPDYEANRYYRVAVRAQLKKFDSGWFPMKSQDDEMSFKSLFHGLGQIPDLVSVQVMCFSEATGECKNTEGWMFVHRVTCFCVKHIECCARPYFTSISISQLSWRVNRSTRR